MIIQNLKGYWYRTFTPQPEEPDDNDFQECPDKFEPMQRDTTPKLRTVSDSSIADVKKEAQNCAAVYGCGMLRTLEILGLDKS
jgi:hypothetical protein